jgi:hypothetical protein
MAVLYPHCTGLDVHKDTVVARVRHMVNGTVKRQVRTFANPPPRRRPPEPWICRPNHASAGSRLMPVPSSNHRNASSARVIDRQTAARPARSRRPVSL